MCLYHHVEMRYHVSILKSTHTSTGSVAVINNDNLMIVLPCIVHKSKHCILQHHDCIVTLLAINCCCVVLPQKTPGDTSCHLSPANQTERSPMTHHVEVSFRTNIPLCVYFCQVAVCWSTHAIVKVPCAHLTRLLWYCDVYKDKHLGLQCASMQWQSRNITALKISAVICTRTVSSELGFNLVDVLKKYTLCRGEYDRWTCQFVIMYNVWKNF